MTAISVLSCCSATRDLLRSSRPWHGASPSACVRRRWCVTSPPPHSFSTSAWTPTPARSSPRTLTTNDVDDGSQVGPLLDQVDGACGLVHGRRRVRPGRCLRRRRRAPPRGGRHRAAALDRGAERRRPRPRRRSATATSSASPSTAAWAGRRRPGTTERAQAEAAVGRWKQVIGDGLRARIRMSVGRPRWRSPPRPSTVCWNWDARAMSASPDPDGVRGQCARTPDPCTTLPYCSRKARAKLSRIGCVMYRKKLRCPIWTCASTGMPGVRNTFGYRSICSRSMRM